ncbi:MAG: ATP-grasp domain-containing protein [Sphingomonadales bacterium]|nr:ATP-grasp domain-containing protein [Sphingomonadales bacterium]
MSRLLVVELPGGSDADVLAHALEAGHEACLLTADAAHYRAQPDIAALLERITVLDAGSFDCAELLPRLAALRFDAVLCLQDLRIVEAAQIAQTLGLRFLDPAVAALCRDKQAVRARLAAAGMAQPPCLTVTSPQTLLAAVAQIGLPVVVKPTDGFGSQNVFAIRDEHDLAALHQMPELVAAGPGHYGLGVAARGAMLVERLLEGVLVGCDTLSCDGRHQLLGVNEKLFFPPPSFAIRGGCFTTNVGQFAAIEAHVVALLDAIGFDQGAAHIELMLTTDGPRLVEINPRLVGARLPRLLDLARGRSIHADLIGLHADGAMPPPEAQPRHAVTRWIAAAAWGVLDKIILPPAIPEGVLVMMHAYPGQDVCPPFDNADRVACVMACDGDRALAEARAKAVADAACVQLHRAA